MGALASGNVRVLNEEVVNSFGITENIIEAVAEKERVELERRERLYRGDAPFPAVSDKTIVLVDDGLATGSTMRAAVAALRRRHPNRIIVCGSSGASIYLRNLAIGGRRGRRCGDAGAFLCCRPTVQGFRSDDGLAGEGPLRTFKAHLAFSETPFGDKRIFERLRQRRTVTKEKLISFLCNRHSYPERPRSVRFVQTQLPTYSSPESMSTK